jgi:hypothetical protein
MNATLAEKVMGRLAGRAVRAGEMVEIAPDWTFALDDGIGLIDQNFRRYGVEKLARPERIALFYDHYAPADTPLHAEMHRIGRALFDRFGLPRERLFDVGAGISHQVAVESGWCCPGRCSPTWIRIRSPSVRWARWAAASAVPRWPTCGLTAIYGSGCRRASASTCRVHCRRAPAPRTWCSPSWPAHRARGDLQLHRIPRSGPGRPVHPRAHDLCNMGIEMGAKFAVVPADGVTRAHFESLGIAPGEMPVPMPAPLTGRSTASTW